MHSWHLNSNGCCFVSRLSFLFPLFFFFLFQKSPVFKNTSKWQALKQMHSDQVEFWRGSVWAKATCDMYAQPTIIRCRYWMNSSTHISQTDSVKQEKFWCSVHRILMLLFFHLVCVAIQNIFGFFGFIYICVCVCVYINMHCFNAVNNAQNYQVNPAVSETTFTTRWKASRATYNESQWWKIKGNMSRAQCVNFKINK